MKNQIIRQLAKALKKNNIEDAFSYAKFYKKYDNLTLREIDEAIKLKGVEA